VRKQKEVRYASIVDELEPTFLHDRDRAVHRKR
jgi:hypothetical protein